MTIRPKWWKDEIKTAGRHHLSEKISNWILTPYHKAFKGNSIRLAQDGTSQVYPITTRKSHRLLWSLAAIVESLLILPPIVGLFTYPRKSRTKKNGKDLQTQLTKTSIEDFNLEFDAYLIKIDNAKKIPPIFVKFLEKNAQFLNETYQGKTLLQKAQDAGAKELFLTLIVAGSTIDPNKPITIGQAEYKSPLFLAVDLKNLTAVYKLLNVGANRTLQDNEGNTPLHKAASYEIDKSSDVFVRIITTLVSKECANLPNLLGETPLHIAAKCRFPYSTKTLLNYEILNPNIKNNEGLTPLMVAASKACSFAATTDVLANNRRVKKEVTDKNGKTALHYAYYWARQNNQNMSKVTILKKHIQPTQDNLGHQPEEYLDPKNTWEIS